MRHKRIKSIYFRHEGKKTLLACAELPKERRAVIPVRHEEDDFYQRQKISFATNQDNYGRNISQFIDERQGKKYEGKKNEEKGSLDQQIFFLLLLFLINSDLDTSS